MFRLAERRRRQARPLPPGTYTVRGRGGVSRGAVASRGSGGATSRCGIFYSRSCFGRRRAEASICDGSGLWDAQSQRASKTSRGAPRWMCARRFAPLERVESVAGRLVVRDRFSSGKRERPRRGARGRVRRSSMLFADGVRCMHVGTPAMHSVCSLQPGGGHRRAPSCLAAIAILDELLRPTRQLVPPARARTRKRPQQATSRHPGGPRWRRHRREPLGASWSRIAPSNPPAMRFRALRAPERASEAWQSPLTACMASIPVVLLPTRPRGAATTTSCEISSANAPVRDENGVKRGRFPLESRSIKDFARVRACEPSQRRRSCPAGTPSSR